MKSFGKFIDLKNQSGIEFLSHDWPIFFAKPFLLSEYVGQSKAEKKEKVKEKANSNDKDKKPGDEEVLKKPSNNDKKPGDKEVLKKPSNNEISKKPKVEKESTEKEKSKANSEKEKVKVDFRPFIHVEGVAAKEVREQKIDLKNFTAIILTSRNSVGSCVYKTRIFANAHEKAHLQ